MWLSLVERCVRDAEAAGSSPVTSTTKKAFKMRVYADFKGFLILRFQGCDHITAHSYAFLRILSVKKFIVEIRPFSKRKTIFVICSLICLDQLLHKNFRSAQIKVLQFCQFSTKLNNHLYFRLSSLFIVCFSAATKITNSKIYMIFTAV